MRDTKVDYSRSVDIKHDVDVLIVGGGPAGCAAAWAAAKAGASVLLIEGQGSLGGLGTNGRVPAFMQFGDGETFLAQGFGWQLLKQMEKEGGLFPKKIHPDNRRSIGIDSEVLKRVYDDMLLKAGVKLSLCTQLIDVQVNGRIVSNAICAAKSGIFAIRAKTYIDCSGDGDLCAWAGAEFEKGDENGDMMPGTLCSLFSDINYEGGVSGRQEIADQLKRAISDGVFTLPDMHLPGIWRIADRVGGGNISHAFGVDGTDELSLTQHFIDSRKRITEYIKFYKEYLKGFEDMQLMDTGSLMGIRETRRVVCDYMMTIKDFQARARFDDAIGRYCYHIDVHVTKPDMDMYLKFKKNYWDKYVYGVGENYEIPYRSLIPKDLDNVLVAGRCMGTDRPMQGSLRVMPGCYITGQAAGIAAALSAQNKCQVRQVPTSEINQISESFCVSR